MRRTPPRAARRRALVPELAGTAVLLALLLALLPLLPPLAGTAADAAPSPAAATCGRPAPTTDAGYSRALRALPQGGDATLSVRLPSGRVAWIFADTLGPRIGFVHSTVVLQRHGCFVPSDRQLLPDDPNGRFWWPMAATALPGGSVLVAATDGYGGHARAALCRETPAGLVFVRWLPYWPQGRAGLHWYAGLLLDGPTLRVYGTRHPGGRYVLDREVWAASVPVRGLLTGRGWRVGTAPLVAPGGADDTVAAYRDRHGYHLVTLQGGPFGRGPLVSLDAARPAGPFTRRVLVARVPPRPGQWRYNAAVHPAVRLRDARLLVSVNNNWPIGDTGRHPVPSYQPSFLAVRRR